MACECHVTKHKTPARSNFPMSNFENSGTIQFNSSSSTSRGLCPKNFEKRAHPNVRCTRRGLTKKIYAYVYIFRTAPSRTWRVREGALRKIYAYVYIFRKAPSRTWRVREGALRARMCALVTFKFSRVTN